MDKHIVVNAEKLLRWLNWMMEGDKFGFGPYRSDDYEPDPTNDAETAGFIISRGIDYITKCMTTNGVAEVLRDISDGLHDEAKKKTKILLKAKDNGDRSAMIDALCDLNHIESKRYAVNNAIQSLESISKIEKNIDRAKEIEKSKEEQ